MIEIVTAVALVSIAVDLAVVGFIIDRRLRAIHQSLLVIQHNSGVTTWRP